MLLTQIAGIKGVSFRLSIGAGNGNTTACCRNFVVHSRLEYNAIDVPFREGRKPSDNG